MKPENFRIALGYLNEDMHVPNNKNIIFLLDSRKRKFKTSNSDCWNFSNRIDTVDLRLFPRKVYRMLITINMKSDIAFSVMSIRYTFRGNNLKSIVSTLLEKIHRLYLEVLNSLFLLSRRNMIFLLVGMCISPLR